MHSVSNMSFIRKVFNFVFGKVSLIVTRSLCTDEKQMAAYFNMAAYFDVCEDCYDGDGRDIYWVVGNKEAMPRLLQVKLDKYDIAAIVDEAKRCGYGDVLDQDISLSKLPDFQAVMEHRLGQFIIDELSKSNYVKILMSDDTVLVETSCIEDLKVQMDLAGHGSE